jgi:hypothetical protein
MADDAEALTLMASERGFEDAQGEETEADDVAERQQSRSAEADDSPDAPKDKLDIDTDRIGTAALESLFTERTEADEDEGEESATREGRERQINGEEDGDYLTVKEEGVSVDADQHTDSEADDSNEKNRAPDEDQNTAADLIDPLQPSRAASPVVDSDSPQRSPTRPIAPARPPRPVALATSALHQPAAVATPPLQLVTFDVGGTIFRCKASLIHKFPTKRLHHVISCGCEQIDHATFFIDRNPQHFELVLDWYRTGKGPRTPLPRHINEETLRDDAMYFDLYDELFPTRSPAPAYPPPRAKSPTTTSLPRVPDRPTRPPPSATPSASIPSTASPPLPVRTHASNGVVRFGKREVRLVSPADSSLAPTWFSVKGHEHLVVESVKGTGKLLVRVTDATGMARVFVDQAVLFDSRSWFYLEDDGRARLQHCVLPGNHVYTFWMEPRTDIPSPPPPQAKAKPPTKSKASVPAVVASVVSMPQLEVAFRVISTFSRGEEMNESDGDLVTLLQSHKKGNGWGDHSPAPTSPDGSTGSSPFAEVSCLFLPPKPAAVLSVAAKQFHGADNELDERDAIAQQIRELAATNRTSSNPQQPAVQQNPETKGSTVSALKRNGAAIAHQPTPQKVISKQHGQDKVTVYQPLPIATADIHNTPRSSSKAPPLTYSSQQPRQFRPR